MCNSCGSSACGGCDLQILKGDPGDAGDPGCVVVPITSNASHTSAAYATVGTIILGNDICEPFTAAAIGIAVGAGTGSVIIIYYDTAGVPTTLYENNNITSTNVFNIELAKLYNGAPLSIAPAVAGNIVVRTKHNTGGGGNTVMVTGCTFYYE